MTKNEKCELREIATDLMDYNARVSGLIHIKEEVMEIDKIYWRIQKKLKAMYEP